MDDTRCSKTGSGKPKYGGVCEKCGKPWARIGAKLDANREALLISYGVDLFLINRKFPIHTDAGSRFNAISQTREKCLRGLRQLDEETTRQERED